MAGFGWGMAFAAAPPEGPQQAHPDVQAISISAGRDPLQAPELASFCGSSELSDLALVSASGARHAAHKLLLCAWSEPFKRMLTGDMREARAREVTLHGVDDEVLHALLQFLYTCRCSVPVDKLVALASLADMYEVSLLQELALDAARSHMHNHNCCAAFLRTAKAAAHGQIEELAREHLANNLNTLTSQLRAFASLELEEVLRLCRRPGQPRARPQQRQQQQGGGDDAAPPSPAAAEAARGAPPGPSGSSGACSSSSSRRHELQLFTALMHWLDAAPARGAHKQQLLRECVDWERMTNLELSQMRHEPHVQADAELKELLLDACSRRLAQPQQRVWQPLGLQPPPAQRPQAAPAPQQQQQQPPGQLGPQPPLPRIGQLQLAGEPQREPGGA